TLRKFVDFFNPTVKIPTRKLLSSKILIEHAEQLEQSKISILSKSQEPITIMFDSWKNDISNQRQRTPNVLNIINTFLTRASSQNLNVVAMVMDSASAYASARQILKQAIGIASYFTDQRHSKAISSLCDEQQRIYKAIYSFVLSVTTRWNSYYYCFATLLRSKRALQSYSILYPNSSELSDKSRTAINSNRFWAYLDELVEHLLPFVSILDYLQRDAANLFDVTYAFGY
ncbi:1309_t:CDS:2, partial [Gigaspora rosea]